MIREIPLELEPVRRRLLEMFADKLEPAKSGTPEERERNLLSRALAAYSVHKLAGCPLEEAAAAVVDGGGDGGIDALYCSATNTLWVVQSKFLAEGLGEPDLGSAAKFKQGLENLLSGRFEAFRANSTFAAKLPLLDLLLDRAELQVRAVLVYSGIHTVSEDRLRMFEDLEARFAAVDPDHVRFMHCNLTTVFDWITGADDGPGVPMVELMIASAGVRRRPYQTVFGLVSLEDLARLHQSHGKRLIAANIRGYKGNTEVNEQILSTIRDEPQHFAYLNNGLTAFCSRLEIPARYRSEENKRVKAYGFSIVNGAQTLGSIADFFSKPARSAPDGYAFMRLISLKGADDEQAFAERLTRSTNFQNQIGLRDFASLDPQQKRIAHQLELSGVTYHYKADVDNPASDGSNFTLEEALTACACLASERECDLLAKVVAHRPALLSNEAVFPSSEPLRSRYARVFRPERSARKVWRAVQAQRAVKAVMTAGASSSKGIRKAFFENARWLILNVAFLKLKPEQGQELALTTSEQEVLSRFATDAAEVLWTICETQGLVSRASGPESGTDPYEQPRTFKAIFGSPNDCQRLRSALLARMAG